MAAAPQRAVPLRRNPRFEPAVPGAQLRYRPVVRCVGARVWPGRPLPPRPAPRAAPWTGDGVRPRRRRNARSSGPSSARSVKAAGWTVRNVGPRPGSTTATTTFEWLGMSNTIPSRSGPRPATLTSSPGPIVSTGKRYRARCSISGALAAVNRNWEPRRRSATEKVAPTAGVALGRRPVPRSRKR